MQKIVFVCLGNICRSPAAEAVLAAKAPAAGLSLRIDSAGTGDWHVGEPAYGPMSRAAAARGYDLSGLRARQFTARDFAAFDLIVVMDKTNERDVERLRPAGSATPVRQMMSYAPQAGANTVPDPYYTRDFGEALDLIERAVDGLVAELGRT
ncbi:low molecular weight protein-tyrosine-phosphatase [Celeribacter indicus]|uniref:protein-tyrosine-phosphatase n=1 Tax=Celeribacter indicus TaxID=1208324 RepID=A0A0B5DWS9_9RHOB|nr:low molecular weight protein-tyrosine-phosphatase [Celeribacter indicus]AJE45585.1 protein tyrosine phosphatase [Celeribacter indicus]SDW85332.1 protein-tyrosine phosphatase [Celeribacter indicus]